MFCILNPFFIYRAYNGLFTSPEVQFPGRKDHPTSDQVALFGGLLRPGDLLTDTATVSGTKYKLGQVVVVAVGCSDLITVGVILQAVLRKNTLLFIVSLYDAIRTPFGFWQACPSDKVNIVNQKQLADFKPLYKRNSDICFHFVLHHHLPTPFD